MVTGRKTTSGHHMSDTGIFVRACAESRSWVIRCLSSRKLVVSRNAYVVRDPNSRHAQLALSDELVGRHGTLDTSPGAYRAGVRALSRRKSPRATGYLIYCRRPAHWRAHSSRTGSGC